MRNLRIFTSILLATLFSSACAMQGYQIVLRADRPELAISRVREILLENGFEKYEGDTSYQTERFRKNIPEIPRGFLDRNTDYWVHVEIDHKPQGHGPGEIFDVHIYNAYVGNNPKFKPFMIKTAESIENAIKKIVPAIKVQRSEWVGTPFI